MPQLPVRVIADAIRGGRDPIRGVPHRIRGVTEAIRGIANAIRGVSDANRGVPIPIRGVTDPIHGVGNAIRGVRNPVRGVPRHIRGVVNPIRGLACAMRDAPNGIRGSAYPTAGLSACLQAISPSRPSAQFNVIPCAGASSRPPAESVASTITSRAFNSSSVSTPSRCSHLKRPRSCSGVSLSGMKSYSALN